MVVTRTVTVPRVSSVTVLVVVSTGAEVGVRVGDGGTSDGVGITLGVGRGVSGGGVYEAVTVGGTGVELGSAVSITLWIGVGALAQAVSHTSKLIKIRNRWNMPAIIGGEADFG